MEQPIKGKCTSLYEQIKKCENIDLRDNRGKKHCIAFVLLGVMLALCRNKDGNLSSIHRAIKNTNEQLCSYLEQPLIKAVSRAQLPLILKK
ncbi:hypothetical protein [Flavobacterium sp.]|uniref:hypothetical protein n=1 Tax=Flavobacterium sp. TaxID=239 RepID=UPI00374D086C